MPDRLGIRAREPQDAVPRLRPFARAECKRGVGTQVRLDAELLGEPRPRGQVARDDVQISVPPGQLAQPCGRLGPRVGDALRELSCTVRRSRNSASTRSRSR